MVAQRDLVLRVHSVNLVGEHLLVCVLPEQDGQGEWLGIAE